MIPTFWHGTGKARVRSAGLISSVQQRAMGSGQPYLKSGTFAWLKHTILYGKLPVWAFIIVSSILLLLLANQGPSIRLGRGAARRTETGVLFYAPQNGSRTAYVVNTCTRDQELVSTEENFLPPAEFEALQSAILGELKVRAKHRPAGATRCLFCIHVLFNTAGVPRLMSHPKLAAVYPYFEKVRLPDATNFDISVTMVEPAALEDHAAYSPHWDTTLTQHMARRATIAGISVSREWEYGMLSDTSNVIYLQVPTDMTGGQFRIWDPRKYDAHILRSAQPPPATEEFELKENMRVQFRGDALHSLDGFQSAQGLPRVSLVIKQYKLSPGDYAFSPQWVQPS